MVLEHRLYLEQDFVEQDSNRTATLITAEKYLTKKKKKKKTSRGREDNNYISPLHFFIFKT